MNSHDSPPPTQLPALPQASFLPSGRVSGWTPERQKGFCEMLAQCGRVDLAANAVGMTRDGAYKFRTSIKGRPFALAWDAALMLARQRLIDEAMELAFEGSVERIYRDGKVIAERRKRDVNTLLIAIERLGRPAALGSTMNRAIAQEYGEFLECVAADADRPADARPHSHSADFLEARGEWSGHSGAAMVETGRVLKRAMRRMEAQETEAHNGDS